MNLLTDVLQSQITRLQEEVRGLASWRTGIAQSVDPPTVIFPRDTVATPADTLTQQITPGQVVLTLTLLRRVWIIGIRGGTAPDTVIIGGVAYARSGEFASIPAPTLTTNSPVSYGPIELPRPYAPPSGYGFALHVLRTSRYPSIAVENPTTNPLRARWTQFASSSWDANTRIGWTLVKLA